jgi:hypothetical protein
MPKQAAPPGKRRPPSPEAAECQRYLLCESCRPLSCRATFIESRTKPIRVMFLSRRIDPQIAGRHELANLNVTQREALRECSWRQNARTSRRFPEYMRQMFDVGVKLLSAPFRAGEVERVGFFAGRPSIFPRCYLFAGGGGEVFRRDAAGLLCEVVSGPEIPSKEADPSCYVSFE